MWQSRQNADGKFTNINKTVDVPVTCVALAKTQTVRPLSATLQQEAVPSLIACRDYSYQDQNSKQDR